MRKNKSDYKGIYSDMVEILGEEIVMKLHEHYRGQQITFPMKLYSNEYIEKYIVNNYRNKTLKEMCRDLGYTEGWIKQLLNKLNVVSKTSSNNSAVSLFGFKEYASIYLGKDKISASILSFAIPKSSNNSLG